MPQVMSKILLTGKPGVGKTTCIEKLIRGIQPFCHPLGFVTREIREAGHRVGFELEVLHDGKFLFAHRDFRTPLSVGRYGVQVAYLNQAIEVLKHQEHELGKKPRIYFIDEIGKMEALSAAFREWVENILNSPWPVVATIALKGTSWIEGVKRHSGTHLIHITVENRNERCNQLQSELRLLVPTADRNMEKPNRN